MFLLLKNNFFNLKLKSLQFSFLFFFFVLSTFVNSEVYEVLGMTFDVNNVSQVSDAVYKVKESGEVKFFNKFELESYLVNKKFSSLSEFENTEIELFLKKALREKRIKLAASALHSLNLNKQLDTSLLVEMLASLKGDENYLEFAKAYALSNLSDVSGNILNQNIAEYVFLENPGFLRRKAPTLFYSYIDNLSEVTLQKFYSALIEYNVKDLKRLNNVLRQNFSIEDVKIKKALILYDKCGFNEKDASLINDKKDLSQIFDYYQIIYQDVELSNNNNIILKEKYVNKIHLIISEALMNKEFNTAFHFFSLIPFEWRTPTTHEHALVTVKNIESNSLILIEDLKAINFLAKLSSSDSEVKEALEVKLEKALKWFLAAKKFKEANIALEYLKKIHPDSEVEYLNKVYISFAKNYLINSDRYRAEYYLSKVKGFIGFKNLLWFLVNSYYVPVYLIAAFFGLIFLFVIIRCLEFKEKPKLVKHQGKVSKFFQKIRMRGYGYGLRQKHEKEFDGFLQKNRRFSQNTSEMKDPRVMEFQRLLAGLGINKNSTLQDIKDAYRRQVKLVHPDVSKSEDDAKRFVELTKTYERLMELYDELYS